MDKSKKSALLLYTILAAVVIVSLLFILRPAKASGRIATIQVGSKVIMQVELDDAKDGSISIEQQTGIPITFEVKDGAIRFIDSDCPDKVCVKSGFMRRDMDIASCLPNKTVLSVETKE